MAVGEKSDHRGEKSLESTRLEGKARNVRVGGTDHARCYIAILTPKKKLIHSVFHSIACVWLIHTGPPRKATCPKP